MSEVRIVTDSACDIPPELAAQLDIAVVPLVIRFDSEIYLDGELSHDAFWDKVEAGPHHPGTSQPSLGAFEQVFARLVDAGHQVLCVSLTSKHSGTFSSALMAAQRFGEKVKVIDSLSLSFGQGFQVLAAAKAALKGVSIDEIERVVAGVRERLRLFILLDTVEHIQRGGRAAALIPLLSRVTKVLNIKPILDMPDGQLGLHKMVRSYERGLSQIKQELVEFHPFESLAVLHTRCGQVAQDMARALAEKLNFPLKEIVIGETGPVLSVHGGPKVLGVIAVSKAV
ncbi:MAG: DegV family protein [Anaerolineae bacterium]|nr:DegV family protein [Anaerolineae bacterium]